MLSYRHRKKKRHKVVFLCKAYILKIVFLFKLQDNWFEETIFVQLFDFPCSRGARHYQTKSVLDKEEESWRAAT